MPDVQSAIVVIALDDRGRATVRVSEVVKVGGNRELFIKLCADFMQVAAETLEMDEDDFWMEVDGVRGFTNSRIKRVQN